VAYFGRILYPSPVYKGSLERRLLWIVAGLLTPSLLTLVGLFNLLRPLSEFRFGGYPDTLEIEIEKAAFL
jgi:hypothetical protein